MDPFTGEKRTHLIVILLVLFTDFWTHPIACLFVYVSQLLKIR
jgi:hypothetical protein